MRYFFFPHRHINLLNWWKHRSRQVWRLSRGSHTETEMREESLVTCGTRTQFIFNERSRALKTAAYLKPPTVFSRALICLIITMSHRKRQFFSDRFKRTELACLVSGAPSTFRSSAGCQYMLHCGYSLGFQRLKKLYKWRKMTWKFVLMSQGMCGIAGFHAGQK